MLAEIDGWRESILFIFNTVKRQGSLTLRMLIQSLQFDRDQVGSAIAVNLDLGADWDVGSDVGKGRVWHGREKLHVYFTGFPRVTE